MIRTDITQSGTYELAPRYSTSPLVQITGLNRTASTIAPFVDVSPPHGAGTLQAVGWRARGSQTVQPAGTLIIADGAYEFVTGGLPLKVTLTLAPNTQFPTPGTTVTFVVFPDGPVTPTDPTVKLSNGLVLDAVPVGYPDDLALQFQLASDGAIAR